MRCSICGAKLIKEGDVCTNCYKLLQEEEKLNKDTNILLELNRKYSIAYEITKNTWIFIILVLSAMGCFATGNILAGLLTLLILAIVIGFLLFLDKRLAMATKAVFYETKVVYTFKFLIFDTEKVVKYENIKDVKIFRTFTQRKYGYGDICVYAKGTFPGATLLNGFLIKNIEDVDNVVKNIIDIVANATINLVNDK